MKTLVNRVSLAFILPSLFLITLTSAHFISPYAESVRKRPACTGFFCIDFGYEGGVQIALLLPIMPILNAISQLNIIPANKPFAILPVSIGTITYALLGLLMELIINLLRRASNVAAKILKISLIATATLLSVLLILP